MDFSAARRNMVERQVRTNKVTDEAVLEALAQLPRERFVPESLSAVAYIDEDVPLDNGRYLMEPMVFARLVQAAQLQPGDRVLDLGCGCGYSTAILSRLANQVIALESDSGLAQLARERLDELSIGNAAIVEGPLEKGWPEQAPYNAIVLGGAAEVIPDAVMNQLADGGRLVGVENRGGIGRAMLYLCHRGVVSGRPLFDAAIALLPGMALERSFVF
jgi:protein-L-isoaspartate(D-aspartate) O-methyltransferase